MSDTKKDFELKSRLRQFQEAQLPKLGTGQARKAGEELYRRSDRVDAAVEQASQPAPAEREEREEDQRKVPADFRFADGGTVGSPLREEKPWWMPSLSWLGTGAARNAGEAMAGRPRQIDNAVDAMSNGQAPQQPQYPQPQPQEEEEQPSRPAPAGFRFADGGRVAGKGGRTDDKVGPVMLSDEEYVLPADTADAIGRDVLDQLRLHTHDFKDDRKESALRKQHGAADHLADGGSPDWLEKGKALGQRALAGAQQYGNQAIDYAKSKLPGLQQQAADYGRQGLAYGKQVGAQAADFARSNLNPDALRQHAATVQQELEEAGLTVTSANDWPGGIYNGEVQIMASKGGLTNAYSLAQIFPKSTVQLDKSLSDDDTTVSVVLGKEYLQNAMNADEIKLLGSDKPITAPSDCVPADKAATKKPS